GGADESQRPAGYELLRGKDLRADSAQRQRISVLLLPGSQIVHHPSIAGAGDEGAGILRDLRRCIFGKRPDCKGYGFGRWRKDVGTSGTAGAGAPEGLYSLPRALALGWQPRRFANPRMGRRRQRAAAPRQDRGATRRDKECPARNGFSEPALQRHYQLGDRAQWGGETCLRLSWRALPLCSRSASARALPLPQGRILASRSIRAKSRRGTSAFCRTAPASRPAAVRRRKGRRSTRRSA